MAQSDVSLRLIALVAIGGIADMPRASGACRSGASDPTETLAARFAVMHKRRRPDCDSLSLPGVWVRGEGP